MMPIGRGLIDVDIFGIDVEKRTVLAQVTQSRNKPENARKLKNLLAHKTDDSKLYYFGHADLVPKEAGVTVFNIEDVFNDALDDSSSREMIFRMLGQNEKASESVADAHPSEIEN